MYFNTNILMQLMTLSSYVLFLDKNLSLVSVEYFSLVCLFMCIVRFKKVLKGTEQVSG